MEVLIESLFVSTKASLLFVVLLMAVVPSVIISASDFEGECTEALTTISPCLPYIASPPNNLSSSASLSCCEFFSSASDSGNYTCLCYLLRQPSIFGFPLNTTRISSLFFVCPLGSDMNSGTRASLETLCEVSGNSPPPPPPPMPSSSSSPVASISPPLPSFSNSESPVPSLPMPQALTASSPITMNPSEDISPTSSTSEPDSSNSCQFLSGIITIFIFPILAYL